MYDSKSRTITEVKHASIVRMEEEARMVIDEANLAIESRLAAKAKAKAEEEIREIEARARTKARAAARVRAIAEEEARIEAAGANLWYYIQNEDQIGPVSLSEMREKASDLTLEPSVKLVWTEGMDAWKPVYEVRKLCEPLPSIEAKSTPATEIQKEPVLEAMPETAASTLFVAVKVEDELRAKAAESARIAAEEKARAKADEDARARAKAADADRENAKADEERAKLKTEAEAKLRVAEAATASAEAKAAEQARLREAAEAKALSETKLRALAEAKAAQEIRIAAEAKARAEAEAQTRAKAEIDAKLKAAAETKAAESARAAAEAKAAEEARLRIEAEAKAAEESKRRAIAEAKADEEARAAAAAMERAKAEEEKAKTKADAEAKLKVAEEARASAEAKAAEQARLREFAEAKAASEEKRRAAAEAKAAEEARIAAAARARAEAEEQARIKVEKEAKLQAAAEAKVLETARLAAEAKATEEAKHRAAAEAKAAEEARAAASAMEKARAEEEKAKAKSDADAKLKVAEEARAKAEAKAAEESRLRAIAESKSAKEAKLAAAENAKAKEEAQAKAELESKLRAAAEAKAHEEVHRREAAEAKAAEEAKQTRQQAKAKILQNAKTQLLARAGSVEAKAIPDENPAAPELTDTKREIPAAKPEQKSKPAKKTAKSIWFYTCEGERLGPVTFEELRAMASGTSLDPRLDMVWKQTMDAWVPAGKIDGLFERQAVSVKTEEKPAPVSKKTARAPKQKARPKLTGDETWPGARRRSLFLVTLLFPFIWEYGFAAGSPFLVKQAGPVIMGKILPYAPFVPLVVVIWFWLQRLVNLGMNRMWILATVIPGLNLWLGYRSFVCPAGYAYDRKLDGPGLLLAVLYGIIVLAGSSVLVSMLALHFGMVENPELQQQLRGLIRIVTRSCAGAASCS